METLYHMDAWFSRPPGSTLLNLEHQHIDPLLSQTPGQVAIQMGGPSDLSLIQACRHQLKCYYSFSGEASGDTPTIRGNLLQLPLQPDCTDLIVMAHTLAFCPAPRKLLAQLYHSLHAGGLLLILGFNPLSQFGVARMKHNKEHFPYSGHFHLPWKVKMWLKQEQFSLIAYRTFGFYLPSKKHQHKTPEHFSETLGRLLLSGCGGVYMILAQKVDHGMTPLAHDWWKRQPREAQSYKPSTSQPHPPNAQRSQYEKN